LNPEGLAELPSLRELNFLEFGEDGRRVSRRPSS
jgi:hypothetical protein